MRCLSKRKDTNFKANHNSTIFAPAPAARCLSKRKDTNFKANHNSRKIANFEKRDVCLSAKIRILKQITTPLSEFHERA